MAASGLPIGLQLQAPPLGEADQLLSARAHLADRAGRGFDRVEREAAQTFGAAAARAGSAAAFNAPQISGPMALLCMNGAVAQTLTSEMLR